LLVLHPQALERPQAQAFQGLALLLLAFRLVLLLYYRL
jgi:hypothetical protein